LGAKPKDEKFILLPLLRPRLNHRQLSVQPKNDGRL